MSSILKALRKLEEERSSPADRAELVARSADTPSANSGRLKTALVLLFCGVLLGGLSVGGWLLLAGKPAVEKPIVAAPADVPPLSVAEAPPPEPALAPVAEAPPPEPPLPPVAAASPHAQSSALPAAGAPSRGPSASPAVKAPRKPAATVLPPAVETPVKISGQAVPEPDEPDVVERVMLPEAGSVAAVDKKTGSAPELHPLYKVTEIYYQDAGGSVAVINDLPVMEGTMVNDGRVDKILTDRVRLIIDGKAFDILLEAHP